MDMFLPLGVLIKFCQKSLLLLLLLLVIVNLIFVRETVYFIRLCYV